MLQVAMCSAAPAHGIEFYDETVGAGEARMGLRLRPSDPGYLAWATAIHRFYRAEEKQATRRKSGPDTMRVHANLEDDRVSTRDGEAGHVPMDDSSSALESRATRAEAH
ncbi:hypothetical protein C2857_007523 [Epichloe festucae Fl1]|uniref:Uncharacterized protein n=1 Tax=Epichloe festucae (strain Fl1) TaxID=877507 RepID=A0A7S9KMT8_EPIFF|nr:hypothetical protein C2857_007523 [Epichloe festucae Fl1]